MTLRELINSLEKLSNRGENDNLKVRIRELPYGQPWLAESVMINDDALPVARGNDQRWIEIRY